MSLSDWVILIWFFLLGACVGSFLNVVVYRLPAGKSLLYPGSRCPNCEKAIRRRHNVPILGWFILRGLCYDCGSPLSIRYPLVEGIAALWFTYCATFVVFVQHQLTAMEWMFSISLAALGSTVICSALILYERKKIPRILSMILVISAGLTGILAAIVVSS